MNSVTEWVGEFVERVHSVLPQTTGEPEFFELNYIWQTAVIPALWVAAVLYLFHFGVVIPLCTKWLLSSNHKDKLHRDRMAFQATNLVVNTLLTGIGFYFESDEQRKLGYQDVTYRLQGFDYIASLTAWHVGVQLWSFPIGLWMIQEDTVMLMHHVALVWTAIAPCCIRIGFRWHVPFFFGYVDLFFSDVRPCTTLL